MYRADTNTLNIAAGIRSVDWWGGMNVQVGLYRLETSGNASWCERPPSSRGLHKTLLARRPSRQPDSRTRSLDCGGMARATGSERTKPLSMTQGSRVRGFTRTCIARKAIRATPPIGTTRQAKPVCQDAACRFRAVRRGQNGSRRTSTAPCAACSSY